MQTFGAEATPMLPASAKSVSFLVATCSTPSKGWTAALSAATKMRSRASQCVKSVPTP